MAGSIGSKNKGVQVFSPTPYFVLYEGIPGTEIDTQPNVTPIVTQPPNQPLSLLTAPPPPAIMSEPYINTKHVFSPFPFLSSHIHDTVIFLQPLPHYLHQSTHSRTFVQFFHPFPEHNFKKWEWDDFSALACHSP